MSDPFGGPRAFILVLRGGVQDIPAKCDDCEKSYPPDQLHPASGGTWICDGCLEEECP